MAQPASQEDVQINLAQGSFKMDGSVFAPFRYGDKIYFTAVVPTEDGQDKVSRIFSTINNEPPQMMAINPKEDDINAAHATLNATGDRIYYTLSRLPTSEKSGQSEICFREKNYDGTWGNPIKLPKHINQSNCINSQPACGYDNLLKKDLLFFVSNLSGGKGGFDIWYCTVERDGSFGIPTNLPCNTPADDIAPNFLSQSQVLFFSSHTVGSKGGFDIYSSEKNAAGEWKMAENLNMVNSSFDELFFSYHQPSRTSYFCSNRPNDNCNNLTSGCPDFSVFTSKLGSSLVINILSELDSTALFGCNVELEDTSTGIIEKSYIKLQDNSLQLSISPEKKYRLIVSREGFFPLFHDLEQVSTDFFRPVKMQVILKPMRN